jgi:hypothetical protein
VIENRASLLPFFAAMFFLAFGLNFLWEMLQMSAYAEMAGRSWRETALTCAVASVGDAALTLVIYGIGALVKGSWRWVTRGGWKNYLTAALLAVGCAAAVERAALATGRWSYLSRMPVPPLLGVGLWPFLQLTLLVPLTLRIAVWWAGKVSPRSESTAE